ncbi:unnamed protein product [Brassica oleracea]
MHKTGPFTFRIHGQNAHRIGSLVPGAGQPPKFSQLYIIDTANEIKNRISTVKCTATVGELDPNIVKELIETMDTHNCLTKIFRKARDIHETDSCQEFSIRLKGKSKRDRQYDMPQTDEIAGLIVGDFTEDMGERDIIVQHRSSGLQHISDMHPLFMTLQYPILFPYGQIGFNENIPVINTDGEPRKRGYITKREYFAHQIQTRLAEGMVIVRSKRLFHQYIVDAFTCIEQERLRWFRLNQKKIRADLYNNIQDAVMKGDTDAKTIGKRVILPSSYTGSPRYMAEKYHDAMAICRWHGNPDLFITITTNPKWEELSDHLKLYGTDDPNDRPDLESRVFKMKLDELMSDFNKGIFFPRPKAVVYTIEFQKRGLPHAHILLWLEGDFRNPTAADIDNIISAELPDKEKDPEAFGLVEQHMMHGPCGKDRLSSPCMDNGVCTKKFPRSYVPHTQVNESGYILYKRRQTGQFVSKGNIKLDNQFVVPHNLQILKKYKAHVNVEWCNKSSAIKYLFKYITKGVDRATFKVQKTPEQSERSEPKKPEQPRNEINEYIEGRYLSACESMWRIFVFDIHHNSPAVQKLPVHLPGEHMAVFDENEDLQNVEDRYLHGRTMLTEWFEMNRRYEEVRKLKYIEMLTMFVWDNSNKIYIKRQQRGSIGRIVNINPAAGDKYYLGILVSLVRGPTCYDDLYTVGEIKYDTFQEACYARGFLGTDKDWHDSMSEASQFSSPRSLRYLFVLILIYCQVSEPRKLWDHSWEYMAEDVLMRQRRLLRFPDLQLTLDELQHYTLIEIETLLQNYEKSLTEFAGMPLPNKAIMDEMKNRAMARHNQFDLAEEQKVHQELFCKLNNQQRAVYDAVINGRHENFWGENRPSRW